jgi:hypothetical protein
VIDLILYILALVCFIIAAFGLSAKVNFIALGLAFWVLTLVLSGHITIGTK